MFSNNETLDVQLLNPTIKIQQDFDLSKDTKFSMRTLLLLCVFCMGVFGFGLNPNFFGYDLTTNYRSFIVFCIFLLVGQTSISFFQYRLNLVKLREYLCLQSKEIKRLGTVCQSKQGELNNIKQLWDEALAENFPLNKWSMEFQNKEQLDNYVKPFFKNKERECNNAEAELKEAKRTKIYSEMVYKWINGNITFALVAVSILLGVISFCYNTPLVDTIFSVDDSTHYISLNVKYLEPKCLLRSMELPDVDAMRYDEILLNKYLCSRELYDCASLANIS